MKMWKQVGMMAFFLCAIVVASLTMGKPVYAASSSDYQQLFSGASDYGRIPEKHGKYYFKYLNGKVYMSKKKSSGYKATPLEYNSYTNGKQAYYISKSTLCKYTFSNKKAIKLKKMPVKKDYYFYLSEVYGNQIFITKGSFDEWTYWTYRYNTKTKNLKNIKKNCTIVNRQGKYVVAENSYRSDVSPTPVTLYKITSSGLKKIKKLTERGFNSVFVDGKLYYTEYTDVYMTKVTLYRCNSNGKGKKALGTFASSSEYGQVLIQEITSKKCTVYIIDEGLYEYTYSTKKLKKIN